MYTKTFLCKHGSLIKPDSLMTPDQCRSCRINLGIDKPPINTKHKSSNSNTTTPSTPCFYRGDQLGVIDKRKPLQVWYKCDHKVQPLGSKICSCNGCGPSCVGYRADNLDTDNEISNIKWAHGVTTVPDRRETYLPKCLESLVKAGLDKPVLFIDNCQDVKSWDLEYGVGGTGMGLQIVPHIGGYVGAYANWLMALTHLYVTNPTANRYAIFQDDAVACMNMKKYLDSTIPTFPRKSYLNLYTSKSNEVFLENQGHNKEGWYKSTQRGRGAVALVFGQDAVKLLLQHPDVWGHVTNGRKGHKNIDGVICDCLIPAGFIEYVHSPSLVQHIGMESTIGNAAGRHEIKYLTTAPTS